MKRIIIIISTVFLFAILGVLILFFSQDRYITKEEAKQIAKEDISNKDGKYEFASIEFTETNDTYIYTLIFNDNVNLYTYKINAKNKKIIYSKKESLTNNKEYMREDDILNIVFEHSNLNKINCNIISNLVTLEDGFPIYNTIFYNNNIRYEYKTNAYTGAIISVVKLTENAT